MLTNPWQPFKPTGDRPWSPRLASHLLRRAGFGGTVKEIDEAVDDGLDATIERLFNRDAAGSYNQEMASAGRMVSGGPDSRSLAAWWLLRMAQTPCPLIEKMTLFWHGHFATSGDKVQDARAMLRQNVLIRRHALGNFEPLVQAISRDPAMLIYLDSEDNRKTRPNENYARELMELFCLGPGNYTERDIKEVARSFTGWEIRKGKFRFNRHQHDDGKKTILGKTGDFDGDEAVTIVLEHDAAARFIARKLVRFFVFDRLDISEELIEPLARQLRQSDFEIGAAVETILRSRLFYCDDAIGQKIKSPVELAIGFLRFFEATVNMQQLSQELANLGQLPLYPPNVKGWDGGKAWINASTVLARANLIAGFVRSKAKFANGDLNQWAKSLSDNAKRDNRWITDYLLAVAPPASVSERLQATSSAELPSTIAWLAALPEFQLN